MSSPHCSGLLSGIPGAMRPTYGLDTLGLLPTAAELGHLQLYRW